MVVSIAEEASRKHGIAFLYRDFRSGWREGQQRAKELGMYRQQYCGCIYSEAERFCSKAAGLEKERVAAKPEFDQDSDLI
jgi:predicted adenine nucleotide alpha hydrolase (AANH) superfamily ATPase